MLLGCASAINLSNYVTIIVGVKTVIILVEYSYAVKVNHNDSDEIISCKMICIPSI